MSTISDIDHLGPLRAALIKLHPAFEKISRAGFSSTPLADGGVMFRDPTLTKKVIMVFPCSVQIAGVVVGDLAPELPEIIRMNRIMGQIPRLTGFILSFDEKGNGMTLTDRDDRLTTLEIFDISKDPRGRVNLAGRGKPKAMTGKHAKAIVDAVKSQVFAHVDRTLGTSIGTTLKYFTISFNHTGNIVERGAIQHAQSPQLRKTKDSDFVVSRLKLESVGLRDRLKKLDGIVYEPIRCCPCAYVERSTYKDFINTELRDDNIYNNHPRGFDDLMKFLTNYVHVAAIPTLQRECDLLSFSNGVMELSTGSFTSYKMIRTGTKDGLTEKVARHHIPSLYTGGEDTPLFDTILNAQFGREVAQVLCALLGRLFFKIGQHDNWQVMPFISGVGGTGKSLLLKIVERWFARGAVGNLASKREEIFGMANLVDKEVVMGRDMPAKLSASLSQDIIQSMTSGEGMEIPRKCRTALHVQWSSPVIMASNHMPDYVNTGNNVARRMVVFRFDNVISNPQEDLEERILSEELPNIICRCLSAYRDLRARVKATQGGFWRCMPTEVLSWRGMLIAATSALEAFQTLDTPSSAAERAFKTSVEQITGLEFHKVRCGGILSPTGNPLELDLYYESEGITVAIEYNGYQHYVFPNTYHQTREEFDRGQLHDRIKLARCRELGLALIVIRGSCLDEEMTCFRERWSRLGFGFSS